MRFDVAWGKIASENHILKILVFGLFGLTLFFGLTTIKLSNQGPVIIERSCISKAVQPVDDNRTPAEIEVFLKESLNQRFSTNISPQDGYLSSVEMKNREEEQKEFKQRQIEQSFLFYSYKEIDGKFHVDADRIIRVGEVRSAFRFPLIVNVQTKARSTGNPYGLILEKTEIFKGNEKQ